ncbi:hypothetical protein C2G38_2213141 [Gigaspora rosea]|uniref:Uncharacterized protein n=1 Tax=Gigaspora rosea TaxID=44941 RepID=A0A397UE34_9GLOM|nr:hypothetical protein C2G38_2213141 [Gigaspora rosea]
MITQITQELKPVMNPNGRLYYSYYNIISLENYPTNSKLTQKTGNHMPQYLIPDNYIVETEVAKKTLKCETKYIASSKICYTVSWKENHTEWSVNSVKSSTEAINIFLQKINQKASRLSGPRHKLTDLLGKPIVHLQSINLNLKNKPIQIKFKDSSFTTQIRLDSVIRACDEALLDRDGYRHLAAVIPTLFREYLVANRQNKINMLINKQIHIQSFNIDNELFSSENSIDIENSLIDSQDIGNGVYHSISTLLQTLIPIWKSKKDPIIIPGDTLYLKLGGNGRNVGRKQSHVLLSFCLLNEKMMCLNPIINTVDLKNNGIVDKDGIHWPIEFYFSGDWKFAYIIMGQNAPNSEYFCLYCECNSKSRHNMDLSWTHTGNSKGQKKPPLFFAINLFNFIPDELHLLLRITNILMDEFIPGERGITIEFLWREFYRLYMILKSSLLTEEEILKFKDDTKNWIRTFCRPTIGKMNTATSIQGIYRKEDITPYMHVFAMHIPYFIR